MRDNHLMQAPTLEWSELDLETVTAGTGLQLLAGNDATLSGVAEARTGAAAGAGTALHLIVEVGIGGTLLIDGVPAQGASGAGGEFGHMPFGDRGRVCPCGARGCWDLEIDGRALARHLQEPAPDDPYSYTEACCGVLTVLRSVRSRRWSLHRTGIAGLVNAHDPDVVTLGGLAIPLRAAAEETFEQAYLAGLMTFHRTSPPPVLAATHQPDGPLRGAAALALDHLTSERRSPPGRLVGSRLHRLGVSLLDDLGLDLGLRLRLGDDRRLHACARIVMMSCRWCWISCAVCRITQPSVRGARTG